jgi:hypothetical protein
MKNLKLLAAALVLAMTPAALAEPPTATARVKKDVAARIAAGDRNIDRAHTAGTPASRLDAYDDAIREYKAARRTAVARNTDAFSKLRVSAERGLVHAYTAEADIYWRRGSLKLARERVTSALAIDARDSRAVNLALLIKEAEATDIYTREQGSQFVDRIRQRRADAGLPLRDRGVSLRR